jgi:hypothetical protein
LSIIQPEEDFVVEIKCDPSVTFDDLKEIDFYIRNRDQGELEFRDTVSGTPLFPFNFEEDPSLGPEGRTHTSESVGSIGGSSSGSGSSGSSTPGPGGQEGASLSGVIDLEGPVISDITPSSGTIFSLSISSFVIYFDTDEEAKCRAFSGIDGGDLTTSYYSMSILCDDDLTSSHSCIIPLDEGVNLVNLVCIDSVSNIGSVVGLEYTRILTINGVPVVPNPFLGGGSSSSDSGSDIKSSPSEPPSEPAGDPDPECSDGLDNDGDTLVDHPADPGCDDVSDNDETDPKPEPEPEPEPGGDGGDGGDAGTTGEVVRDVNSERSIFQGIVDWFKELFD